LFVAVGNKYDDDADDDDDDDDDDALVHVILRSYTQSHTQANFEFFFL